LFLIAANVPGYGKQGVKGVFGSGCQGATIPMAIGIKFVRIFLCHVFHKIFFCEAHFCPDSYREAGLNAQTILP
jgi:hypothetical protein